jgi:hypothetical protein
MAEKVGLPRRAIHHAVQPTGSERGETKMKYFAVIAVVVAALSFGACAKKDEGYSSSSTMSHSSSTGYSK